MIAAQVTVITSSCAMARFLRNSIHTIVFVRDRAGGVKEAIELHDSPLRRYRRPKVEIARGRPS